MFSAHHLAFNLPDGVLSPELVEKLQHSGGGRRRLAGAHVDNLDGVALLVKDLHVVVRLLALVEGGGVLVGRLGGLHPPSAESQSGNFCTIINQPNISLRLHDTVRRVGGASALDFRPVVL
jgi:hypothetical protein